MHVVLALTILFIAAFYVYLGELNTPPEKAVQDQAMDILLKAVTLGENASSYYYSYYEYSDGYPEKYTLISDGNDSSVEVEGPLSLRKAYFLKNDTILCVTLEGNKSCSSVANESITAKYIASLKARLFSNSKIALARSDIEYRVSNGLQVFSPKMAMKELSPGYECTELGYVIDYSNATYDQMSRFGIVSGSPIRFEASACIDNTTGDIYESSFNYTYLGKQHASRFKRVGSDFESSMAVYPPSDISGDAVEAILSENSYRTDLIKCYAYSGSDQERCIAVLAGQLLDTKLCGYAGGRKDRCLVSLMPFLKNESICLQITDKDFKDDCYIELAGALKNSTWCDSVVDSVKKSQCLLASNITSSSSTPLVNATTDFTQNSTDAGTLGQNSTIPLVVQKILENASG